MTFRPIDDVDTIPDWCPLEDDLGVGAAPYRTIEVYYIREMHDVLVRAYRHRKTWMLESKEYWLTKLVQEVGELALSLQGEHEHPPGLELEQIAAICLNWMRHRRRGYIDQDHQG